MEKIFKAYLQKIQANYDKAITSLKERGADAELEMEKMELNNKIEKAKNATEDKADAIKKELSEAWDKFEEKYKSLMK